VFFLVRSIVDKDLIDPLHNHEVIGEENSRGFRKMEVQKKVRERLESYNIFVFFASLSR